MYIVIFTVVAIIALNRILDRLDRRHAARHLRPLLVALSAGHASSFQVVQVLRTEAPRLLAGGEGTVIVFLHRMEQLRLVQGEWIQTERRRRRVYALTAAGRKAITPL